MKKYLFIATALAALASCSSDEFVGDPNLVNNSDVGAISFSYNLPKMTRAADATTAGHLGNQFIVWGEKNETTDGTAASITNGKLVFENYQVNYESGKANSTTSNSTDWEYVGYTHSNNYRTNITPSLNIAQTIKYWDYSADSYTFTAVSAKQSDIETGLVTITKNTSGSTVYDKGYEIAVKEGASQGNIYIADRNNITKTTGTDRTAVNAYGGNVTMSFRNFLAKIRFGIYETIPGYSVKITNVYFNNTNSTENFGADGTFVDAGNNTNNTVFTVTYDTNNKAKVGVKNGTTPNTKNYFESTSSPILSADAIGTDATRATFDKTNNDYTAVLPYSNNTGNIKVKMDFTLTSEDTQEKINVTNATAEIPASYCQWNSNYAYTYILKISEDLNAQIGGVTGLYPITFDAVEITDENGNAEFITTVTEPSITTYAKASAVITNNEYLTGNNIYAAVEDAAVNPSNPDLTVGTNAKLYFVTLESGAAQTITEASVANAIKTATQNATDKTWTVIDALTKKMVVTDTESNLLTAITQIPAADSPTGADLSINGAKFTPASKYVQVPENTDLTEGVTYYTSSTGEGGAAAGASAKAGASTYRKVSDATGAYVFEYIRDNVYKAATGTYVAGTTYYTDNTGSTPVDVTGFEVGVTDVSSYFVLYSPAVKTYKVIKVV